MLHCISWMSNTSRCRRPLHSIKLLFCGAGAAQSVTVFGLVFVFMLALSFPPSFPLHLWLVPIDMVWNTEERGDTLCFSLLPAR